MEGFYLDVIQEICSYLTIPETFKLSLSCRKLYNTLANEDFWKSRFVVTFSSSDALFWSQTFQFNPKSSKMGSKTLPNCFWKMAFLEESMKKRGAIWIQAKGNYFHEHNSKVIKISLLGSQAVGKTCLMEEYINNSFDHQYISSGLPSSAQKVVFDKGEPHFVKIFDTQHFSRHPQNQFSFLDKSVVTLLIYSITDRFSFDEIGSIFKFVATHGDPKKAILVGTKCDMERFARQVCFSQGQALADELGIPFFEVSAKNRTNVDNLFTQILRGFQRPSRVNSPDFCFSPLMEDFDLRPADLTCLPHNLNFVPASNQDRVPSRVQVSSQTEKKLNSCLLV